MNSIDINGVYFNWGMTYQDVLDTFQSEDISTGQSLWKHFEIKCDSILGLDSIACQFRAPSINKPVMQCSFDLVPLKSGLFENVYTPFVKHLNNILGKPQAISNDGLVKGLQYNKGYASSRVIYNCKWWCDDILISLSVFGGIRNRKEGEYAAGLYFDWMNEVKSAVPYYKEYIAHETKILDSIENIQKSNLRITQKPFFRRHYELKEPELALKDENIRTAQLILYTDLVYRTPQTVSKDLKTNEIVIFKSLLMDNWCIGNKWDFSIINNESILEFIEIKPARGSGGFELKINSLTIEDNYKSHDLFELCKSLENKTGLIFNRLEGYDD